MKNVNSQFNTLLAVHGIYRLSMTLHHPRKLKRKGLQVINHVKFYPRRFSVILYGMIIHIVYQTSFVSNILLYNSQFFAGIR